MSHFDYLKDIARYGLRNDTEQIKDSIKDLISYSKQTNKHNFALQMQSILKENFSMQSINSGYGKGQSRVIGLKEEDRSVNEFVLEKVRSKFSFNDLIADSGLRESLQMVVKEHQSKEMLDRFNLPISNKVFFYGPSGCGKTLAAYVLAGELEKPMIVVNMGAVVSAKLGETSKNLAKLFNKASRDGSILFFDEFDTLGKLRDYNQDHAEMKRVVNTFLQLFDYLPQDVLLIAATNHQHIIDQALIRRFDTKLKFDKPDKDQIQNLVIKTLEGGDFSLDSKISLDDIIQLSEGLSFYSIKKTLIDAIKQSLFDLKNKTTHLKPVVKTKVWKQKLQNERANFDNLEA